MRSWGGETESETEWEEEELIDLVPGDKGASRQTTNSSQTNDSNNNFWTGPITRARAKAQQETIGHLANLVRPKEKEETERKEEPACWFNVFSVCI